MVAGAGVDGVVLSLVAPLVVARPLFAAFLVVAAFLAGAFRPDVFFVAFFVVFPAPLVFAAALADFLVDFLAATRRDRALAPLFLAPLLALFLERLPALLRAPFAFLLPFFVAMFGSSSFVSLISHTVTKCFWDVHEPSKRVVLQVQISPGRVWGQSQGVELFERKRREQRRHALPVSAKLSEFQNQAVPVHAQGNTSMTRVDYSSCVVSSLLLSPRVMSQSLPRATERSSQHSPTSETSRREFSDRRSLLVVDDVADIREMLSVMLSYAGYAVVTASSAPAALEAARQRHFDVVISDIGMPEMSGYQLAEALRLLPGYESVPMVAVTGYSMFNDRELSLNAGFNAHVTKPIDPQALLALIEKL